MYLTVCKTFTFEAAHQLPYHDGKCARLHGHSYRVQICVRGPIQDDDPSNAESGMVTDFGALSAAWRQLNAEYELDHNPLNEILHNPTAENLCRWLVERLPEYLVDSALYPDNDIELARVRIYETATSYVEWLADEDQ